MEIVDSIFILFLVSGGAQAFVFSCEEVKFKLINSNLHEPTQFVCLVPQEGYSDTEALKKIYAQNSKVSTSFYDLLNVTCVERPGGGTWSIVADLPVNLDCTQEFALIFTSSKPVINPAHHGDWVVLDSSSPEQLLVSANTGIRFHKSLCTGDGYVSIYTGAGTGVAEFRYQMKSWKCTDLPDWIVAFDNVLTVTVDAGMQLKVEYISENGAIGALSSERVVIMSSGRSDNLQNKEDISNYISLIEDKPLLATAICDPCTFDAKYGWYLDLTTRERNGLNTSTEIITDVTTTMIQISYKLEVRYTAQSPIAPEKIWESDDNFVLELSLTDVTPSSTPKPATTPKPIETGDTDPFCGCGLDKKFGMPDGWDSTDIWIDVVIILDTSEAMGEVSLVDASTLIESIIGSDDGDVLTTDTNANFYTRVGLIAMSDKAEVIFNLNMTKADKVLGKVHIKTGLNQINVLDAFSAAQTMLVDGQTNSPERNYTRQVIYYMTDSDPKSNLDPINQFKTSQGVIIVNNFVESGGIERPGLKELASPGYYYTDIQDNYMSTIQLFCKANCYCRPDKDRTSYPGHIADPTLRASGGCMRAVPAGYQFSNARKNCDELGGGLIASIHDQDKANFVQQLMHKTAPNNDYFWIGYSKSDAGWRWEDQSTNPWTHWDTANGEPNPSSVAKCAYMDTTTPDLLWGAGNCNVGFPSVCEFKPCMVGNKNC